MPPMPRARLAALALSGLALLAACGDTHLGVSPRVVIAPILDSLFVGDTLAARTARYFDAQGDSQATGPIGWASSDTAVLRVDSVSGELVGRGRGSAVLTARANGITGSAFLVVARALEVSLLLDTILLMPGGTVTVPVGLRVKGGRGAGGWVPAAGDSEFR